MNIKAVQYILLIACLFSFHTGMGQRVKRANQSFVNHDYARAIKLYTKQLKKDSTDTETVSKLGLIYYKLGKYERSEHLLSKVYLSKAVNDTLTYYYLKSLCNNGNQEQAYSILNAREDFTFKDHFLTPDEYGERTSIDQNFEYWLSGISVNTHASEFSPTFYGEDKIAFVSDRFESGETNELTGRGYHKTYVIDTSDLKAIHPASELFEFSSKAKYNMGPVCFNGEGTEIYFTKNVKYKGKDKKAMLLKIFYSRLEDGEWTDPEMIPYDVEGYSDSHPYLSKDGRLYFTSDRPGGYGGVDIYMLTKEGDTWSTPVNLGAHINTMDDEMTPFVSDDNVLFFSSKGHPGIGGLDIFMYDMKENDPVVRGLPSPVNGLYDDLSYTTNNEIILFSSNRKEGSDNIYLLEKKDCYQDENLMISGFVYNDKEDVIANAQVHIQILNEHNSLLMTTYTDADGFYTLPVEGVDNAKMLVTATEHYPDSMMLEQSNLNSHTNFYLQTDTSDYDNSTQPEPNDLADEDIFDPDETGGKEDSDPKDDTDPKGSNDVMDKTKSPTMELYFEYDKSVLSSNSIIILDSYIELINSQAYDTLIVGGHTDSRGSKTYNKALSLKRAKFIADYIKKRIEYPERVVYFGYGEERLRNKCSDGVPCTEHEHLKNRRISIDIR